MTADWLHRYNYHRPHDLLGRVPPVKYRVKQVPSERVIRTLQQIIAWRAPRVRIVVASIDKPRRRR